MEESNYGFFEKYAPWPASIIISIIASSFRQIRSKTPFITSCERRTLNFTHSDISPIISRNSGFCWVRFAQSRAVSRHFSISEAKRRASYCFYNPFMIYHLNDKKLYQFSRNFIFELVNFFSEIAHVFFLNEHCLIVFGPVGQRIICNVVNLLHSWENAINNTLNCVFNDFANVLDNLFTVDIFAIK